MQDIPNVIEPLKKNIALLNPQLDAFMAVAKHKTVHAAARSIHLSQTAVTQRIHGLEQKIHSTLFIRTRQGMTLSSEGEKLLRYCHAVTDYSNETLMEMQNAGTECLQRVQISGPSSIMISRVIPSGMGVLKRFPALYINFDVNDMDAMHSLRLGQSQFSIIKPEEITRDMESKSLLPEKYLLVCSHKWKKRKLEHILRQERIIDFNESDQTTFEYLKQFNLLKYANADRLYVNRTESLSTMFVEGYGYGVLTKEFSKLLLKSGKLIALNAGKTFDNFLKMAWYKRPQPPHYFSAIIDAVL